MVNGAAVLKDPKSDLTCNINASASRKRNRDTANTAMIQQFQFPNPSKIPKTTTTIPISNNNNQELRLLGSAGASTSGWLASQHFTEIDALLQLHNAKLRSGLGAIQKRRQADFVQILEDRAAKRMMEKEAEMEGLKKRQAELEARLMHAAAENQIWFAAARNSEAVVSGLRASLDQALRGDAAGFHVAAQAEDAESCCGGGDGGGCAGCVGSGTFRSCCYRAGICVCVGSASQRSTRVRSVTRRNMSVFRCFCSY